VVDAKIFRLRLQGEKTNLLESRHAVSFRSLPFFVGIINKYNLIKSTTNPYAAIYLPDTHESKCGVCHRLPLTPTDCSGAAFWIDKLMWMKDRHLSRSGRARVTISSRGSIANIGISISGSFGSKLDLRQCKRFMLRAGKS
jgi:hypothetical protein